MVEDITGEKVEGPVIPKDVDTSLEDEIRVLKRKRNDDTLNWYQSQPKFKFKPGTTVTTKKVNEGELFAKRAQKSLDKGTISGDRDAYAYSVMENGKELKRKYLPWELKLVSKK